MIYKFISLNIIWYAVLSSRSTAFKKLQFLDTQQISARTSITSKTLVPIADYILQQNLALTSLDTCNQWNESRRLHRYDDNERKNMTYWSQMRKSQRTQRLSAIVKNRKHIAPIGVTSDDVTVFQTQNVIGNVKNISFLDNSRVVVSILEDQHGSPEPNIKSSILLMDDVTALKTSQQQSSSPSSQDNKDKPSQEQLQCILDCLSQDVCYLTYKVF